MTGDAVVQPVTCLGCGCTCDDVVVHTRGARIVQVERSCARGVEWFGDGSVPSRALAGGESATIEQAIDAAARLLADAEQVLVCLGPDLSCEAQREGVALADLLHARIDVPMARAAAESILATQRRGRAGATLGEMRNRADLIVLWGVNPTRDHPRFLPRFATMPDEQGANAPAASRKTIVVGLAGEQRLEGADEHLDIPLEDESPVLAVVRAAVLGRRMPPRADAPGWLPGALALAERLSQARYSAIVYDAERAAPPRQAATRTEALIALAQTLNGPSRCALVPLGAGGNRAGAHAVLAWQTGFPMTVDFGRGAPRYRPEHDWQRLLDTRAVDALLLLGAAARAPSGLCEAVQTMPAVVIGPRASEVGGAEVAIDTGVAGIHEAGAALRMDDVPLPLRPPLEITPTAAAIVRALRHRVGLTARERP